MARRAQAGFTLLELLLALSIFAVVAAGIYGTIRAGVDAQRSGEEMTRVLQIGRVALDRIVRAVRGAYVSQGALAGEFIGEDLQQDESDTDLLIFVAATYTPKEDEAGECDLVRIEIKLDLDTQTEETGLVMSTLPAVLDEIDEAPDVVELAPEVVSLNFRYYDGEQWLDTWDSTNDVLLPKAVEIKLAVARDPEDDDSSNWRYFSTVVALPMAGAVTQDDIAEAQAAAAE